MAVTPTGAFPQNPKSGKVQILNADASNLKTIYTGGANGSKITSVVATSSDTSARDVTIGISNSGTFYPFYTVTIAITAGQIAATPPVNLLPAGIGLPVDNDGQTYIFLQSASDTLQVKALTTVTSAKEIDINSFGADF
jgi:hypothetical protein